MSRSFHVTIKNFRNYTKLDLKLAEENPDSDLHSWSKKKQNNNSVIKNRRSKIVLSRYNPDFNLRIED